MILILLPIMLQTVSPDSGEVHLRNIRQVTFGGQNAEAYFSRSGRQIIFQRQEADSGCDQEFVMNVDGTGLHRVSSGKGRTTFVTNSWQIRRAHDSTPVTVQSPIPPS